MRVLLASLKGQFRLVRATESKQVWQHVTSPSLEVVGTIGLDPWAGPVGLRVAIQRGRNRNGSEYAKGLRLLVSEPSDDRAVRVLIESDRGGVFASPEGAILFAVLPVADRSAVLVSVLEVSEGV